MVSDYVVRQNQVLIASRFAMEHGRIQCSAGLSAATAPNWLHVRLATGVDVVGFRRPMLKGARAVTKYWDWLSTALEPLSAGSAVVLGDFNTVPQSTHRPVLQSSSRRRYRSNNEERPMRRGPFAGVTRSTAYLALASFFADVSTELLYP